MVNVFMINNISLLWVIIINIQTALFFQKFGTGYLICFINEFTFPNLQYMSSVIILHILVYQTQLFQHPIFLTGNQKHTPRHSKNVWYNNHFYLNQIDYVKLYNIQYRQMYKNSLFIWYVTTGSWYFPGLILLTPP